MAYGAIVVACGAVILGAPGSLIAPAAAATQPNIVVIMTDDQAVESLRVMPKTRALIGDKGTTFSNSFVSFPLCCPSRATLLTGQYPHNHGVLDNAPPNGGYSKLNHANTLPVWLQQAGYYTSHIGKYLNGYGLENPNEVPPGWSHWQGLVHPSAMYNYTINDNGMLTTYGEAEEDYQTDVLADRAEATIDEGALNQPFFLSIAPLAPHGERSRSGLRAAPRHVGAFSSEPLPQPPSFNESDVSDKPAAIRNLSLLTASDVAGITQRYRDRLASLLAVDDLVERVVNRLESTGILGDTVLIFTCDNGFFHGEHRIPKGKQRVYEEAVRVPLLIRGGGFPPGKTANQYAANIDLAPTIVDLAGASAGRVMDGRSLLPLARDSSIAPNRDILVETLTYQAVRNSSFLYVEHGTGEQELYDMRSGTPNYDPYQLQSRHAEQSYSQIKGQLATQLNGLRTCSGASCDPAPISAAGSLQFSAAAYEVNEGSGNATFTVTRTGGSDGNVAVDFTTPGGTATAGADYTSTSGSLTWLGGDTAAKTFSIPIINDPDPEGNETVNAGLRNAGGGATLGSPDITVLTITDNDNVHSARL